MSESGPRKQSAGDDDGGRSGPGRGRRGRIRQGRLPLPRRRVAQSPPGDRPRWHTATSAAPRSVPPCGEGPRGPARRKPAVQQSGPVSPRSLTVLLLLLLGVTGCTTVMTAGSPPAGGRTPGVRAPLAPDGPKAPMPATPLPARSALVRTGPDRTRHAPKAGRPHRHRPPAPVAPTRRPRTAVVRTPPAPRVHPAPRRRPHPHARTRHTGPRKRHPAVRTPRVHPLPYPRQMRQLCRSADGVTAPDIAGLCHEVWD